MNTEPQFLAGKNRPLLIDLASWQRSSWWSTRLTRSPKASDDLVLDLVNVTAIIKNDPEDAGAAPCRVEIVEPRIDMKLSDP
jgi:hypothetical protein